MNYALMHMITYLHHKFGICWL